MLNLWQVIGNLGADPEQRFTQSGTAQTTFSVACSRTFTQDGQKREETEWVRVVTWGKLAETCAQYLGKGRQVYVSGRAQTRSWDGNDGQKHTVTELVAQEVKFLGQAGSNRAPVLANGAIDDSEPF